MIFRTALLTAFVVAGVAAYVVFREAEVSVNGGESFVHLPQSFHDYDLFDLGVTDVDGDANLDVFTVNHSARQSLLRNDGAGGFTDVLSRYGLDQDRAFAALEDDLQLPEFRAPGLYIYRHDRWLYLDNRSSDDAQTVSGLVTAPWPLVSGDKNAGVRIEWSEAGNGAVVSKVTFELAGGDRIRLNGAEDIVEVPHRFVLADDVDLTKVFIGADLTTPDTHEFELTWRDRHGVAWSDINDDGVMDVFIARGGIKGQLDSFPEPVFDELLTGTGSAFSDITRQAGLMKGNCPARQVAWVDADRDGDLDLYVSCGRGQEPVYPNQLFRRNEDLTFVNEATPMGLDFGSASVFAWFDADGDNDADMLSYEDGALYQYINNVGTFTRRAVEGDLGGSRPYKLAVADFDNDGDGDVYAVHGRRSLLLVNSDGEFRIADPESIGLPATGRTANWVDFDNDGLVDLHVVPGGLYRQSPEGTFSHTGVLGHEGDVDMIVDARATWFDMDNDGDRDVIISALLGPTIPQRIERRLSGAVPDLGSHWRSAVLEAYLEPGNGWLQVELDGPDGNPQGIGATVRVTANGTTQTQEIGWAEGSHFGQGHYRAYFGLGETGVPDSVSVTWPDGTEQSLANVAGNQLLRIRYAEQTQ